MAESQLDADDELLVGSPPFSPPTSLGRLFLVCALLGVGAVFIAFYDGLLIWVGIGLYLLALILAGILNHKPATANKTIYTEELLSRSKLAETAENLAKAGLVYEKRKSLNNLQTTLCFVFWIGISISAIRAFTNFGALELTHWSSYVWFFWQGLLTVLIVSLSLIPAVAIGFTDRVRLAGFEPTSSGQSETLSLPIEDKNDIDIAGLGVALQAIMRRADSYTIEATLLGGLSFSAFIAMSFSDAGPVENASWLLENMRQAECWSGLDTRALSCLADIAASVPSHLMFSVSVLTLLCSMLFMSTIMVRFQFNEAYRHTEEILAVAKVLNDKEDLAREKSLFTSEITKTLERARDGLADLGPLSSAMRLFRGLGVVSFVLAVAVCGMYINIFLFYILLLIVLSAYLFTNIDNFRRKLTFLRRLQSVFMSAFHRSV